MIIVLNGASSSGKTTLARALQARWDGPLLYLALDTVIGMLPFHYTGTGEMAGEGFELFPAREDGFEVVGVRVGHAGRILNAQLATVAADLSEQGLDVLVDHVFFDAESFAPFGEKLDPAKTYLVGVHCGLGELVRRESERGDRMVGLARFQAPRVHWLRSRYDLEVDTTCRETGDLAAEVYAFLRGAPRARLSSTSS